MAWEARSGLKLHADERNTGKDNSLNGLGGPFGFETFVSLSNASAAFLSKWLGRPVRV
jgi:hypothetical protein